MPLSAGEVRRLFLARRTEGRALHVGRRVFPAFMEAHPPSSGARAARLIRKEYNQPLPVASLARRLHVSAPTLSRDFVREFGVTIHEFQCVLRVPAALERVPTDNVDAVAAGVGYQSSKNFRRALRRLTGLTPTGLRALSADDIAKLRRSVGRPCAPPDSRRQA